jgi:hypothetical protein
MIVSNNIVELGQFKHMFQMHVVMMIVIAVIYVDRCAVRKQEGFV